MANLMPIGSLSGWNSTHDNAFVWLTLIEALTLPLLLCATDSRLKLALRRSLSSSYQPIIGSHPASNPAKLNRVQTDNVDLIYSNFAFASRSSDSCKFEKLAGYRSRTNLDYSRRRLANAGRNLLQMGKRVVSSPLKDRLDSSGQLIKKSVPSDADTSSGRQMNDLSPGSSLNILIKEFNQSNYASVLSQLDRRNLETEPARRIGLDSPNCQPTRIHRRKGGLYYDYQLSQSDISKAEPKRSRLAHRETDGEKSDNLIKEVGSVQELLDRMNIMIARGKNRSQVADELVSRRQPRRKKLARNRKIPSDAGDSTDCSINDDAFSLASASSEFEYHDIYSDDKLGQFVDLAELKKTSDTGNQVMNIAPTSAMTRGDTLKDKELEQAKRIVRLKRAKTRILRPDKTKPTSTASESKRNALTVTKSRASSNKINKSDKDHVLEVGRTPREGQKRGQAVKPRR